MMAKQLLQPAQTPHPPASAAQSARHEFLTCGTSDADATADLLASSGLTLLEPAKSNGSPVAPAPVPPAATFNTAHQTPRSQSSHASSSVDEHVRVPSVPMPLAPDYANPQSFAAEDDSPTWPRRRSETAYRDSESDLNYQDEIFDIIDAIVPRTDVPSMPALTIRVFVVGVTLGAFLNIVNTLFTFRSNAFTVSPIVSAVLAYPLGQFMAKVLPRGKVSMKGWESGRGWWLNPAYVAPTLSAISVLCYISKSSAVSESAKKILQALGSAQFGVGFMSITLDWSLISNYNPITTPLWAMLNQFFGLYLIIWIVIPLCWSTNFFGLDQMLGSLPNQGPNGSESVFPLSLAVNYPGLFDKNGSLLNVLTGIKFDNNSFNFSNPDNPWNYRGDWDGDGGLGVGGGFTGSDYALGYRLDRDWYDSVKPIYVPTFFAVYYWTAFTVFSASLMHVGLWYGSEIWYRLTTKLKDLDTEDIHTRMMDVYPEVPDWWYLLLLCLSCIGSVFVCGQDDGFDFPYYGLAISIGLALIAFVPVGIIEAISGQKVDLAAIGQIVGGSIFSGRIVTVMTFKTFSAQALCQGLLLVSDMKLGHYLKIPPRPIPQDKAIFHSNAKTGTFSAWTGNQYRFFLAEGVIFGGIGPEEFFSASSKYFSNAMGFFAGLVLPLIPWLLQKAQPNSFWHLINIPLMFTFPTQTGGLRSDLITPIIVAVIFNYYIRVYRSVFWKKYAFVFSAALDAGVGITLILVFLITQVNVRYLIPFPNYSLNVVDIEGCAPDWYLNCVSHEVMGSGFGSFYNWTLDDACRGVAGIGMSYNTTVGATTYRFNFVDEGSTGDLPLRRRKSAAIPVSVHWLRTWASPSYFVKTQVNPNRPFNTFKVYGYYYDFDSIKALLQTRGSINLTSDWYNQDISRPPLQPPAGSPCPSISWLSGISPVAIAAFSWDDVIWNSDVSLTVFNGIVLNITQEMRNNTLKSFVSQRTWQNIADSVKHDSTLAMMGSYESVQAAKCLLQTYTAGFIHAETMGCAVTHTLQWILVCCVVCIVAVKVLFAQYHNVTSFFPEYKRRRFKPKPENGRERSGNIGALDSDTPYVILFVTCYSEGLESITSTLNSLATATYPTAKKLLFVVVDGVVKGAGNDSPTADIILGLMTFPPANDVFEHDEIHSPPLRSYLAVAQGNKQHNMAKVFAGHYVTDSGADLPMVLVIKCGTPAENESTAKCIPGNRGKRDSQLILMNFLSRILYNDRMTELDFELQLKVSSVGTDPNNYQLVLMVDADTVVASDSIRHMVEAMVADESIMEETLSSCSTVSGKKTVHLTSATKKVVEQPASKEKSTVATVNLSPRIPDSSDLSPFGWRALGPPSQNVTLVNMDELENQARINVAEKDRITAHAVMAVSGRVDPEKSVSARKERTVMGPRPFVSKVV
ncbi:hypothetical protein HDU82_004031 [Entophlyctis luteolus]|nr:hypothetical protein HDU82_004031 [Entophlyctis luteolus]